jgi:TfoX N-terminal domain
VTYNMELADRIRHQLAGVKRVTEQEMFGGLSFLVAGHMCCGAYGDDLVVRIPPELHHDALVRPHTRGMEMGARAMRGLIVVDREGLSDDADLNLWVRLGLARASALPPKAVKKSATAAKRTPARAGRPVATKAPKRPAKATKKAAAKRVAKTSGRAAAPRTAKKVGKAAPRTATDAAKAAAKKAAARTRARSEKAVKAPPRRAGRKS